MRHLRHILYALLLTAALAPAVSHVDAQRPGMSGLWYSTRGLAAPTYVSVDTGWGTYKGGSSRVVTFTGGVPTTVTVDGTAATITSSTSSTVTFTAPAATSDLAGLVDITLTNATGSSTGTDVYEYTSVGRAAEVAGGAGTKYAVWNPGEGYTLNGSDCSALNDLGNLSTKLNVSQGTASKQPAWSTTSGANGKHGLTFVIADSDVLAKSTTGGGFASGTGLSWGVVASATAFSAGQTVQSVGEASSATGTKCGFNSTGKATVNVNDGTSAKTATSATTLSAGTHYLIEGTITTAGGNKVHVYVNGADEGNTALAAATGGYLGEAVRLGENHGSGNKFGGVYSYGYQFAANLTTASALVLEKFFEETFALSVATRSF